MKYLLSLVVLLWASCALAQTPPSLDGTPVATVGGGSAGGVTSPSFTTTGSSGYLVAAIFNNTPQTCCTISDTGSHVWTQLKTCAGASRTTTVYTAPYSSTVSGVTVTAQNSGTAYINIFVFAVKGAAASPFDPASPVCNTAGNASMTVTNNHDFLFCNMGFAGGGYTAGAGWTALGPTTDFSGVQDQTTSVGGAFTCTLSSGGPNDSSIIAAFTADSGGGGSSLPLMGVGQ